MSDLDEFLAEKGALPWVWGTVDCCMVLADWAIANGYGDPLGLYRGAYDDEPGCLAIIVRRGGLLPIISDGCARVGVAGTNTPARGVIAVIGSRNIPTRQWGALFDGERWQVRNADGFTPLAAPILGMWGV